MKYIARYLILFLSFNLYAATPKEEMTALVDQFAKIRNQGDLEGFARIYKQSDDTLYISTRTIKGYNNINKAYLAKYSGHPVGKVNFTVDDVIPISDHYRFVIVTYHLARKDMPDANGVSSLLFEKIGNDWKIIVDHTTRRYL